MKRVLITDTAIAVLTAAHSRARVTVMAVDDGIAVSLVADAQLPLLPGSRGGVVIEHQGGQHDLWVEARWTGR